VFRKNNETRHWQWRVAIRILRIIRIFEILRFFTLIFNNINLIKLIITKYAYNWVLFWLNDGRFGIRISLEAHVAYSKTANKLSRYI
jgi:hypothetical protein